MYVYIYNWFSGWLAEQTKKSDSHCLNYKICHIPTRVWLVRITFRFISIMCVFFFGGFGWYNRNCFLGGWWNHLIPMNHETHIPECEPWCWNIYLHIYPIFMAPMYVNIPYMGASGHDRWILVMSPLGSQYGRDSQSHRERDFSASHNTCLARMFG